MNCKIYKLFLPKTADPKIKHDTLRRNHTDSGLKNLDIPKKVICFQCSWIKMMYNDSFHEWRLKSLHLINQSFIWLFF